MKFSLICVLVGVLAVPALLQTKKPSSKPKPAAAKAAATPSKKPATKPVTKKADEAVEWAKVTRIEDRTERVAALEKFIAAFPKGAHNTEAAGLIAAARVDAGNEALGAGLLDDAVASYKQAVARVPAPVVQGFWDDGLIKIPTSLYFSDRRDEALAIARTLEDKAGENTEQLLSIARFYLMTENGTEGKRLAEKAIASDPHSSAAYRTVGLAERMQFRLDASLEAFAKARELDPDSVEAQLGLAEMKRAVGKADEALALYDAVIAKQPDNTGARSGRVMALFELGRQSEAETELAASIEAAPGNVVLLASAAYWYAAHKNASRAIELAQKAAAKEPRFIWGHIAYAHGLLLQDRTSEAEATLIGARRYGNFPTLEYEIAAARIAGGYYREAAEGLAAAFRMKGAVISADLGNRVPRSSELFTDLLADERRASIFAPTGADDPENALKLAALLRFEQELAAAVPDEASVAAAADDLAKGDDAMRVHRQLFAAGQMLDRKVAVGKAVELAKSAIVNVERGLDIPAASTAVMASELYDPRRLAATRGEYVNVPAVPRATLSAILRGRIEDIVGWGAYQAGSTDEAIVHLRRAVGVLPEDSAWSRSSTWHLAAALALAGKDAEALDQYIKSYKSGPPDPIRYSVIEALYRKVKGSTDRLVDQIGENPARAFAQDIAPAPAPVPAAVATPVVDATPTNSGVPGSSPSPTPEAVPAAVPIATPAATPEMAPAPTPQVTPVSQPAATPEIIPEPTTAAQATPTPEATPSSTPESGTATASKELFPPVVITIPSTAKPKASPTPTATPTEEVAPDPGKVAVDACEISASEESVTLSGGNRAIIIGRTDDGDIDALEAVSSSPADVVVRREPIDGVRARALYVLRALSGKRGVYQVTFSMPCGKKIVTVNVR